MKILSLNISEKKGTMKVPVDSITVNEYGIVGDAHAGSWHRQVSLLAQESVEKFEHKAGRKMEYGEFAENLTTQGLDLTQVKLLDRIVIGKVVLEVTQIGKECHGDGCAIYREVGKCVMPKEGIFCRVIEGGDISTGQEFEYQPYSVDIRIITLSDRAYKGEYEDLSGPAIKATLTEFFAPQPWRLKFDITVLPDESDRLQSAVESASADGADVLFTTGGTGIGPRDITPDVVEPMLDLTIPGIMEHIRVKYGETIPNALLSRTIAGVKGSTLIYCLPGSVKAVKEYTTEIQRSMAHAIFMLKDVKSH